MAQFYHAPQIIPNGVFRLKNLSTSEFLELKSDGTVVLAGLDESSDGQKWTVIADMDSTYTFRNHLNSSFLGVRQYGTDHGIGLHVNVTSTAWDVTPRGQTFTIGVFIKDSVLNLTVISSIAALVDRDNQNAQRWVFYCINRIPDTAVENCETTGLPASLQVHPTNEVIPSGGANLLDAHGAIVATNKTYKILFADGSELGVAGYASNVSIATPRPPGNGAILKYVRHWNDNKYYGWPQGDLGFFKAYLVDSATGSGNVYILSLSNNGTLKWYSWNTSSYGFTARQLPGLRVALYGRDLNSSDRGLRFDSSDGSFKVDLGPYNITMDCQIVEVAQPAKPMPL